MTIHFLCNEPDAVIGTFSFDTSGNYHDNTLTRGAFLVTASQAITGTLQSAVGEGTGWWARLTMHTGSVSTANAAYLGDVFRFLNESGVPIARLYATGANGDVRADLYKPDGTTVTSSAVLRPMPSSTRSVWAFNVYQSGTTQKLDVYRDSYLMWALSRTNETCQALKTIQCSCGWNAAGAGRDAYYSEIAAGDEVLLVPRIQTYYPSSDGSDIDGIGTYADIDETTTDSAIITLSAVGDRQSFAVTKHGAGVLGGTSALAINALLASDGVNDLKAYIKMDGTRYYSAALELSAVPESRSVIWETRPDTNGPWGGFDLTTLEYGFEVVAP